MAIINPNIILDIPRKVAYEFFDLTMNRQVYRDFQRQGFAVRKYNATTKVNEGLILSSKRIVIDTKISSMNIGDSYEGFRIMDITFDRMKIKGVNNGQFVVGFVYSLK